jgi:hypothetical protein
MRCHGRVRHSAPPASQRTRGQTTSALICFNHHRSMNLCELLMLPCHLYHSIRALGHRNSRATTRFCPPLGLGFNSAPFGSEPLPILALLGCRARLTPLSHRSATRLPGVVTVCRHCVVPSRARVEGHACCGDKILLTAKCVSAAIVHIVTCDKLLDRGLFCKNISARGPPGLGPSLGHCAARVHAPAWAGPGRWVR